MKTVYILMACTFLFACTNDSQPEKLQQELMEADRAFSELSMEKGMNHAFESYIAEDGVMLRTESMPIVGKDAVVSQLLQGDDSAITLTWEPADARVSKSNDLGYTYGVFTMKLKGTDTLQQGTYVSVWVKENGAWKFALDTGNEGLGTP